MASARKYSLEDDRPGRLPNMSRRSADSSLSPGTSPERGGALVPAAAASGSMGGRGSMGGAPDYAKTASRLIPFGAGPPGGGGGRKVRRSTLGPLCRCLALRFELLTCAARPQAAPTTGPQAEVLRLMCAAARLPPLPAAPRRPSPHPCSWRSLTSARAQG